MFRYFKVFFFFWKKKTWKSFFGSQSLGAQISTLVSQTVLNILQNTPKDKNKRLNVINYVRLQEYKFFFKQIVN